MRKVILWISIIFYILTINSCKNSGEILEKKLIYLINKNMNQLALEKKDVLRKCEITNDILEEARKHLIQLNLFILHNKTDKFIEAIGNTIIYNSWDEYQIYKKDKFLREEIIYFKRLIFSWGVLDQEGLRPPSENNYYESLMEILKHNNKLYKFKIELKDIKLKDVKKIYKNTHEFFYDLL